MKSLLASVFLVSLLTSSLAACGGGNECPACIEEKCSDLKILCEADPGCACMAECTGEAGIPGVAGCLTSCDLSERPPGFADLEACAANGCPDSEDECATPANYVVPEVVTCERTGGGIGSGALADCGFDSGLAFDPDGAILQLESADQSVCVRIERRNDGAGELANTRWTLLELRVGPPGEVAVIDGAADQCWYSSHHNFRDFVHASTATRHYDLRLTEDGHDGTRGYQLQVFETGSVDASSCAPAVDGTGCIDVIDLVPVGAR